LYVIDPILAALLADPAPDARLIAADRAFEIGDELLGAWLQYVGMVGLLALPGPALIDSPPNCSFRGWHWHFARDLHGAAIRVVSTRTGRIRWAFRVETGWRRYWRRGDRFGSHPEDRFPLALEAAVLTALRRRLAEVRQG
jgi:hypothetical protein